MIRHEACDSNCPRRLAGGAQNLPIREIDAIVRREERMTVMCAERQGIAVPTDVVERREMAWRTGAHIERMARKQPGGSVRSA